MRIVQGFAAVLVSFPLAHAATATEPTAAAPETPAVATEAASSSPAADPIAEEPAAGAPAVEGASVEEPEREETSAQDPSAAAPEDAAPNAGGASAEPTEEDISLSVRDAVNLAIENNLGVEIERHGPLIADRELGIAWGAYDPTAVGALSYSGSRPPSGTTAFGTDAKTTAGSAALSGLIPWVGASLSLDYTGQKTSNASGISQLSPAYESGLAATATLPLLRGLVWNDPWTRVRVARVGRSVAGENFRTVLMDTVNTSVAAYWNLVASQEQLRVARKSLETSRALRDQTNTQYEVGVKSRVEVIQAEAGVAERDLDVIRAETAYLNAQDILIDVIYGTRLTPSSQLEIQPTDRPSDFTEYEIQPDVATERAMRNRPERSALELEIERQETLVRFRKNQRLPQLDVNASYGTSGSEGDANPDFFFGSAQGTGGDFSDTPDSWFEKRGGREYSVGGTFSIPLGNYSPRQRVAKARLELNQTQTRLRRLDQRIILEVRQGIRALEAARKGIDASERQRIAAEEQLRAERIRLEHGESTPFDVLQKESELVEAESAKIAALQLYRTSVSDLDRAQGTILRNHNIVVSSASELENGPKPESFGIRDLLDPILP